MNYKWNADPIFAAKMKCAGISQQSEWFWIIRNPNHEDPDDEDSKYRLISDDTVKMVLRKDELAEIRLQEEHVHVEKIEDVSFLSFESARKAALEMISLFGVHGWKIDCIKVSELIHNHPTYSERAVLWFREFDE